MTKLYINSKLFEMVITFLCRREHVKNPGAKPYKLKVYTTWAGEPIKYNPEKLEKLNYVSVIVIAAHELGHHVKSRGSRTNREYLAEKFAIKMIKKYWPQHYKKALRFTKKTADKNLRWYTEAFTRVLEEEKNG